MSTGRSQRESMAKYPPDLGESWYNGPKEIQENWVVINQELRFTGNRGPKEEEGNESDTELSLPDKKKKSKKDEIKKSEKILSWIRKAAGRGSGLDTLSGPDDYRKLN